MSTPTPPWGGSADDPSDRPGHDPDPGQYPGQDPTQPYPGYYSQPQPGPEAYPPPPQQPYGYDPYGQAAQQPYGYGAHAYGYGAAPSTNGLAIASLVTSIVSLVGICLCWFPGLVGAVGAILGHVARSQIRQRGQSGEGLALAGIIVGWIGFAIALGFGALFVVLAIAGDSSSWDSTTY